MALLTYLVGRPTQQALLTFPGLMSLMTSQTVALQKRLMQGCRTFFLQSLPGTL